MDGSVGRARAPVGALSDLALVVPGQELGALAAGSMAAFTGTAGVLAATGLTVAASAAIVAATRE